MTFSRSALSAALLCAAASNAVDAQEWTRFRGPNGSGIGDAPSMPAEFSSSDFEWVVELPGTGVSSPVLWGTKLFVTVAGKGEAKHIVLCYDGTNGKQLWEWSEPYEANHKHNFNDFASATPVVDERAVYVCWSSAQETRVIALDHAGKKLWNRSWAGFTSDHGSAASPVLIDGVLIVHTDGLEQKKSYIYGINPADGSELWARERVTPEGNEKHITAYNTPVESKSGDRTTVVMLSTNHGWMGLDPKTGEEVWSHKQVYEFRSVGSIAESGGLLFAAMGSGGAGKQSAALQLNGTASPELKYSLGIKDGLSYVPTPIIHDGLLYLFGDGGVVTCRDAKTGELVYQERAGSGQFFSSPVLVDGKIYCASRDGLVVVLQAGREFKKLAENKLDSGVNATPAVANGRLYFRTESHLISLKSKK